MKLLIAYAGKSGTSRECADLLASLLPNFSVLVADLGRETPDPADYDYIVLGGSVRMGKAARPLRKFLRAHEETLGKKPHTLFLCCGLAEQFGFYAERTFAPAVRESAEEVLYFGGRLDPAKARGFDRLLVRMMRNAIKESEEEEAALPGILPEHIRMLADRLRQK